MSHRNRSRSKKCLNYSLEDTLVFFSKKGKKDIHFTENDKEIVNLVCDRLTELCAQEQLEFDANKFKKLVKNVYAHVRNSSKILGGSKEIEIRNRDKSDESSDDSPDERPSRAIALDLAVSLMFLIGVFLLYISYVKFIRTVCDLTSTDSFHELTEEVKKAAEIALKDAPTEDVSFIYYFWSVFAGFSSKLLIGQQARMIDAFSNTIKELVKQSASVISSNCITQNEGMFGALESLFSFTDPTAVNACIMQTTMALTEKAANDAKTHIALFTARISLDMTQTTNFATYGVRLIQGAMTYLTYRGYRLTDTSKRSKVKQIKAGKSRKTRKSRK